MKRIVAALLTVALTGALSLTLAQSSDTFVYMSFAQISTLDPEGVYDTASGQPVENLYETLYAYDGSAIDQFIPSLATGYSVSDDGRQFTFNLREGVKFHSGNTMTCADVEYSIERILVMNDPEGGVWFQSEALLGTGSNANDDSSVTWAKIDAAVECLDASTVRFNLPALDAAFFAKLLYVNAAVIDSQWAIANGEWSGTEADWRDWVGRDPREGYLHNHASGTGAYRLVSWDGSDAIFESFEDYWGGAPAIKNWQLRLVEETSSRILALQNGDADQATVGNHATMESQVRGLPGVTVHEDPSWVGLSVNAIHLNQNVVTNDNAANVGSGRFAEDGIAADFFSDVDVRKAFSYSFDGDTIIRDLFLGNGAHLTMALPPSFLGYDATVARYEFDLEKAEEHFRNAHGGQLWDTGFTFTISYNSGNTTRQTIAEMLKANVEELNPKFHINVRGIQWPDFLSDRNSGRLPISIVGWVPDYADSDNYLHTFYHSKGFYAGTMNFYDPLIDSLIDAARSTVDPDERAGYYNELGHRAYEVVPTILYPGSNVFMVFRDNVQGVYYNPMLSGSYLWKHISK
ncbi:MAG: ABC transporter substrate-binding protein [Trueperaceae bacterium]|nr:ABC transporter substrate-binding protein [Trueperaceae bacterium]